MLFLLVVIICSFTNSSIHDLEIKYAIKGVYHNLKEGLTKSEFNELTLTTNQDLKVETFQITLARGNRPVKVFDVSGSVFNLRKLVGNARKGDYIVIIIKKLSGPKHSERELFLAIPVI